MEANVDYVPAPRLDKNSGASFELDFKTQELVSVFHALNMSH
jgi:hypothetical protein